MKPTHPSLGRPSSSGARSVSAYARRRVKERCDDKVLMPYRDTSIFNATRNKEQENNKLQRTQRSLDKQSFLFAAEVNKLKELQGRLATVHKRMATIAMKKYSVFLIQALFRGHSARQFCRRKRSILLLGNYLPTRFRWKKMTHASRVIKQAYKRYVLSCRMKKYLTFSRNVVTIQRSYRAHLYFRKAVLRRFVLGMWKHVSLFGVCRATHVVCPLSRHKRIIYRCLVNFYSRLRMKRLETHVNSYRLFYGIFFSESPQAKRHILSRSLNVDRHSDKVFTALPTEAAASVSIESPCTVKSLKRVSTRASASTFDNIRESLLCHQNQQGLTISHALSALQIKRATLNYFKKKNMSATGDVLRYLRGCVINNEMKQFQQRKPSLLFGPRGGQGVALGGGVKMRSSGGSLVAQFLSRDRVGSQPPPHQLSTHRASLNTSHSSSSATPFPSPIVSQRKYMLGDGSSSPAVSTSRKTFFSPNTNSAEHLSAVTRRRKESAIDILNPLGLRSVSEKTKTENVTASEYGGCLTDCGNDESDSFSVAPKFDDVCSDYIMPQRLMKRQSTTQMDPNSIFANLKVQDSDKLVPYELRGNFRLKTFSEVVLFIQNLSKTALRNPLLLQNPLDREISLSSGASTVQGANMILTTPTTSDKPDKSPRFIETLLPFEGRFEHSIFRRGAMSYDFESSVVYSQLSNLKLSSGKRNELRQHVIKSAAVICQQERYARRLYMNPMRSDQPLPPDCDLAALDTMFLARFEQKHKGDNKPSGAIASHGNSTKEKNKRKRRKMGTDNISGVGPEGSLSVREQENEVRSKILRLRDEILLQKEMMYALNDGGDSDEASDTSDSDASDSGGSITGSENGTCVTSSSSLCGSDDEGTVTQRGHDRQDPHDSDDADVSKERNVERDFTPIRPSEPVPSFMRRRNVTLLQL